MPGTGPESALPSSGDTAVNMPTIPDSTPLHLLYRNGPSQSVLDTYATLSLRAWVSLDASWG